MRRETGGSLTSNASLFGRSTGHSAMAADRTGHAAAGSATLCSAGPAAAPSHPPLPDRPCFSIAGQPQPAEDRQQGQQRHVAGPDHRPVAQFPPAVFPGDPGFWKITFCSRFLMKKLWPFAPGIGASLLTESQLSRSAPSGRESAQFAHYAVKRHAFLRPAGEVDPARENSVSKLERAKTVLR